MADRPVAIITGASRGIGKGIAVELAKLGYDILIVHFDFDANGNPDEATARQTQSEIQAIGAACEPLRADVSDPHDRSKLVELARQKFARCDMLCNNAGVAPSERRDILDATEESFERVLKINLQGPHFLSQEIAQWMIRQKKREGKH